MTYCVRVSIVYVQMFTKQPPCKGSQFLSLIVSRLPSSAVPYILPTDLQTQSLLTPNQLAKALSDLYLLLCCFELRP